MNDIETSEITTSPEVRTLIVAGVAGGTGTGIWSQARHFDNALLGVPSENRLSGVKNQIRTMVRILNVFRI